LLQRTTESPPVPEFVRNCPEISTTNESPVRGTRLAERGNEMRGYSPHAWVMLLSARSRIVHSGMAFAKEIIMSVMRTALFAACLLLPAVAWAEDAPEPLPAVADVIFKGVVGKALDVVPMDPGKRVVLQRTNAVVSSTLTGRSLAVWAGLTNPVLLIGGLLWGLYAATNIQPDAAKPKAGTTLVEPVARIDTVQSQVAVLNDSPVPQEIPAAGAE
jgi:hypothetical protein